MSEQSSPRAPQAPHEKIDRDDVFPTKAGLAADPLGVSDSPLVTTVLKALQQATAIEPAAATLLVEERNTWQPESWLIHCCWQQLAAAATGNEALELAGLLVERHPNASLQALYQLARQLPQRPALGPLLQHELQRWHYRLFHTHPEEAKQIERLLLVAVSAALANDLTLAAACLERLDNQAKGWERVIARPDLREQLALTVVHVGPHPLVNDLIHLAVRRYDDAGVQFIHAITTLLTAEPPTTVDQADAFGEQGSKRERLLTHCLDTLRHSTLVTLQSRRIAALVFGQAGAVEEVLEQIATIESVQAAQRATGYATEKDDPTVLRQVKRVNANRDVDFLVYTLRNAADVMPLRRLGRNDRIALADKLAMLGLQSDGWTAASAAATLVELGALRYAIEVVDHIAPNDPARSEGSLMLVRTLMALGEDEVAAEQAKRAMDWAESLPIRNPERALTWGLAELYLQHHRPATALQLLERWREPTGWRERFRKLWRDEMDDDTLRNNRLRFQALLQLQTGQLQAGQLPTDQQATAADVQSRPTADALLTDNFNAAQPPDTAAVRKESETLLRRLQRAAPRLLDGEALIQFYLHGLLQPLLDAQQYAEAWALLPALTEALCAISGNKLAVRVRDVATVLHDQLVAQRLPQHADSTEHTAIDRVNLVPTIEGFLRDLWSTSAERGLWQIVHSIEGTLPLLLQLEGAPAVVTIAQSANAIQQRG